MNKNKLLFAIIGIVLLIGIIFIAINLKNNGKNGTTNTSGDFKIWIIGDTKEGTTAIIDNFKKINPEYSSKNIIIESFSNYEDYTYALIASIIAGSAPDLFVLNNNEKNSIFSNQVIGIDPSVLNPNDFRKKYKGVFSDDLIISSGEAEEEKQEFLVGLPVGYETLGIFYNRRYVKDSELTSLSTLNNLISELKKKKPSLIPIGIGNGSTVFNVSDIITQFFLLEKDISGLEDLTGTKLKQALSSYLFYGDESGYNGFNSRFLELSNLGQNSLDLFSKGETFMVVGYPSLINEIEKKGFSKNFLQASPFPHYYSGDGKTLVNYNYFVINKDSSNKQLANIFLGYLASDIGADNYLKQFSYYLPALLSLESDKLEEKINDKYNIVLNNFFNPDYELTSFNKGIKSLYDSNIVSILDNGVNYESAFNKFKTTILCKSKKIATLENLSSSCE